MTPKPHKMNLLSVLATINQKNGLFFQEQIPDEHKSDFQPFVVMRWMSGTSSSMQVLMMNEFLNPYVFSLAKHKNLLYKLMTVCSSGPQQNKWIPLKESKNSKYPYTAGVIMKQYRYSSIQAIGVIPLLSESDILRMAENQGCQDDIIKKIKTELKNR